MLSYNNTRDYRRQPVNAREAYRSFYTDPIRETGLARNQSLSIVKSAAIARPAEFNLQRMELVEKLSFSLTQELYDIVFAALGKGKDKQGQWLVMFGDGAGANGIPTKFNRGRAGYEPLIPEKDVSKIAYKAATRLVSIIEEDVVEAMWPSRFVGESNRQIGAEVQAKIKAGKYESNFEDA